jgi:citrate lyase subunit beta/citryl-CoA lyase
VSGRSYLFVPGNRPDRFEKARSAGADAVILDLEDAVPSEKKTETRETLSLPGSLRSAPRTCA